MEVRYAGLCLTELQTHTISVFVFYLFCFCFPKDPIQISFPALSKVIYLIIKSHKCTQNL